MVVRPPVWTTEMCCDKPCLVRMYATGVWGMYCLNCKTFTPE